MIKKKALALGINHIVLEVGNLDEALNFYGKIFEFSLRGQNDRNAFIDLGDQFIQLRLGRTQEPDGARHFGFVVDDREAVEQALQEMGVEMLDEDIQFTKAPNVIRGMGIEKLEKNPSAIAELTKKNMAP
jgi:catechol 2,3-dioxygenase-like lactoylglutathione lyase family enzyme